jgi:hypothetical protein
MFDCCGDMVFWIMLFFCFYIVTMYKRQTSPNVLLPDLSEDALATNSAFDGFLILALVFKLLAVIMRI